LILVGWVLITLLAFQMLAAGQAPRTTKATVWSGVYSRPQAVRGETAFNHACSSCHQPNLSGYDSVLLGEKFMDHWREDNLGSFFRILKATMPRGAPASLSDQVYLDIVAFILSANGFPYSKTELTLTALNTIQIEGKDGPKPVPDSALVKTVGCLVKSATGEWIVDRASIAQRTRDPKESSPLELKSEGALTGSEVFHFLHLMPYDVSMFRLEEQKGRKVEVKGFLIRNGGGETLNLTSVSTVSSVCTK
jgi:quinoprotein glucose dehydrogenase